MVKPTVQPLYAGGLTTSLSEAYAGGRAVNQDALTYGLDDGEKAAWEAVTYWRRRNPMRTIREACEATGVALAAYRSARKKCIASDDLAFGDIGYTASEMIRPGDAITKKEA